MNDTIIEGEEILIPTAPPQPAAAVEPRPEAPGQLQTVESHALAHDTEAWIFAAAKAYHRWPDGKEISSGDFAAACNEVLGIPCGYDLQHPAPKSQP